MTAKYLILAKLLYVVPIVGMAAELAINPGLWETTMTRTSPMTTQSITETRTECVKETKFDPGKLLQDAQGCTLIDDNLNGDTLSFRMECNMNRAQAFVEGTFSTDGQTGSGNMDMKVNAGGMNMTMNMNWIATRLGDC
ncbi:MAG: DUF3617 family protein [Arenicellales bacterium]|nr:DUF3617 family protein [Arenicellales bacterium]